MDTISNQEYDKALKIHEMAFNAMVDNKKHLATLSASYIGHIIAISGFFLGIFPFTNDALISITKSSKLAHMALVSAYAWFSISIFLCIIMYWVALKLQSIEVKHYTQLTDICSKYGYDKVKEQGFSEKIAQSQTEYDISVACWNKIQPRIAGICNFTFLLAIGCSFYLILQFI